MFILLQYMSRVKPIYTIHTRTPLHACLGTRIYLFSKPAGSTKCDNLVSKVKYSAHDCK